jgi:hypothetical protein
VNDDMSLCTGVNRGDSARDEEVVVVVVVDELESDPDGD